VLYVLDTNVVSELRKPKPHTGVMAWMAEQAPGDVSIASVTAGEIQSGIARTRRNDSAKAAELEAWLDGLCRELTVLPADDAIFRTWARLSVGRQIHLFADALIAATAIHHGLTVATRNVEDFTRFGVLVANPFGRGR